MEKQIYQYNLLGIQTNALSIYELNSLIALAIESNKKWVIANHNLHSIYIYHHDPVMQIFYGKADYIHIDGMPLVICGRLLGYPLKQEQRVTYADWIWPLASDAAKYGWRIFYLGSKPGFAAKGAEVLCDKYPGLQIATTHGYFDSALNSHENRVVIETINAYQPHILMVGMGMPRQEYWILENLESIKTNVVLTSGACIDYVSGEIPTPPRWMGRTGLEWFHRLYSEPKRLWKRYLIEPWFLAKIFSYEFLLKRIRIY